MKDCIQIGMFGVGVVGSGVIQLLNENKDLIEKRIGKPICISHAVVSNLAKQRDVDLSGIQISTNPDDIIQNVDIDIVLELIGGTQFAEEVILISLKAGKSVITANKAVLAEKSEQIFSTAYDSPGYFGFEASVGTGIPIIRTLREGYSSDTIHEISGIMNGTCNYILTRMADEGLPYNEILKDAQAKGLAEPDPTFDVEGFDTAHKLIILMNLAFNGYFSYKDLYVEGITNLALEDIEYAKSLGYVIKLLGQAQATENGIEGRVHPTMIPEDNILASVQGAFNAIAVTGNYVGPSVLYGLGAGPKPTAMAVVSDVIEACRFLVHEQLDPIPPFSIPKQYLTTQSIVTMDDTRTEYYLRFKVCDRPGVLADISKVLGNEKISIRSMMQDTPTHTPNQPVDVVIVTHTCQEKAIQKALSVISKFDFILEKTKLIRIKN